MRLVVATDEGTVCMNYTWLPVWMGMNNVLLAEVGDTLRKEFKGSQISDDLLDRMHDRAAELLEEKFKMKNLGELFKALKKVEP